MLNLWRLFKRNPEPAQEQPKVIEEIRSPMVNLCPCVALVSEYEYSQTENGSVAATEVDGIRLYYRYDRRCCICGGTGEL